MERQAAEVGRSIGELEAERVLAVYAAIANADLVGGAPMDKTTNTVTGWDMLPLYVTLLSMKTLAQRLWYESTSSIPVVVR